MTMKLLVVSSSAIPTPPPEAKRAVRDLDYGRSICAVCKKEFKKLTPNVMTCSRECGLKHHLDSQRKWRAENREHIHNYSKSRRKKDNLLRDRRRKEIKALWGIWQDWKQAEKDAQMILTDLEGYHNVKSLSYLPTCTFDIVAEKDGEIHAFQVTTCIDIEKKLQCRLADDLHLLHHVIFVSPMYRKYVIKDFVGRTCIELGVKEVIEARKY
jgi:hypothetical protein